MENSLAWFRLRSVPGVGNLLFKRLMDHFGTPEAVFDASETDLAKVSGITVPLARTILAHPVTDAVKKELDALSRTPYTIVTLNDSSYPNLLQQIPDPPPFLYIFGDMGACTRNIAVVGSRGATDYGLKITKQLCRELTEHRITVVSGMARGIDTAAHEGVLEAYGKTIAVLGSGLGRIYPQENIALTRRIAESGAVITEFPLKAGPEAHHFPIRNRIISGISLGTVVVEAAKKSGSLITARLAAEQNREVFAIPGSINSYKSVGTHGLIKDGAKLVENAQDILEELKPVLKAHVARSAISQEAVMADLPPLTETETSVFKVLSPYAMHIDEISRKLDMAAGELSGILLQLELKGIVSQSAGNQFAIEIDGMFDKS